MIIDEINAIIFDENDMKKILAEMDSLIVELDDANNTNQQLEIIDKINQLRDHYLTLYWCSYIGYLKDINDEKYLESERMFGENASKYNNLVYKYYKCLDVLKYNKTLVNVLGERTFALAHNSSVLLSEKNNKLLTKEKELCREYRKLIIGTKFRFNGEEINLTKLSKYFKDDDRSLRKEAYDKRYEVLISLSDSINKIIDELVKIRHEMACNLRLSNYKEYGFIKMNRIGYDEKDLKIFKDNVIKYIVPLMTKLKESQKERLGLEKLEYYDEDYFFSDGVAVPVSNLDELTKIYKDIYKKMDKNMYKLFCDMLDNGLIDLEDRESKSNGGITTYLPDIGYPIFMKKYLGLDNNISTINHETGHSFQLYFSKGLKYHENRWPTFDICEIHSTSNELLLHPYMDKIFGEDVNKYYVTHLMGLLDAIVFMCATDEFQNRLYENPNMTSDERNDIWRKIYKCYYPSDDYSHRYYKMGIMWQSDINRVEDPFYGIDYSLDTVCAFSFYQKLLLNKTQALTDYIALCKDGGSLSLKELIDKHKMCNPFKEEDIKNLSMFIEREIEKILSLMK